MAEPPSDLNHSISAGVTGTVLTCRRRHALLAGIFSIIFSILFAPTPHEAATTSRNIKDWYEKRKFFFGAAKSSAEQPQESSRSAKEHKTPDRNHAWTPWGVASREGGKALQK